MRKRRFNTRDGATLAFSELAFGTAPLGNLYRAISEAAARATLEAAWAAGCRYFDTAPLYGLGLAETRLNGFLRGRKRGDYLLSTKVGRLLSPCAPEKRTGIGKFFATPSRSEVYDYTYDGVMRSVEFSLERLGADSIDILFCHDIDVVNHGSRGKVDALVKIFMGGGYKALRRLRGEGAVKAIGAGVNEWQVAERLARAGDFDLFLLAGRYTLLEQEALETFLPYCEKNHIGIVLGGAFNSGILATGARRGAFFDYAPAPPDVLRRVGAIERVCKAHGVRLPEAALRFPLGHPAVVCVLSGAKAPGEITANAAMMDVKIPAALWRDLKRAGLMRPDAPTPR